MTIDSFSSATFEARMDPANQELHNEIDLILSGQIPAGEKLHDWLKGRYENIERCMNVSIENGSVSVNKELAEKTRDLILHIFKDMYERLENTRNHELSEIDMSSVKHMGAIVEDVFSLPKSTE